MTPKELQDQLLANALGQKELSLIKQQVIIQTLQSQLAQAQQVKQDNTKESIGSLDDLKELREGGD